MTTKITRLLLSAVLTLCCTATSAVDTQPSVGDGSSTNPYNIATKEHLLWFADHINQGNLTACAILTADITVNTGVLDSNGDLNSGAFENWTPIGGEEHGYKGEFNGNGHIISGLYFNDETRSAVGFFGMTDDGANIHELGVKDSYFRGKTHVGGICGDLANGKIENCWNAATVQTSESVAGGIAGLCRQYSSVSGCYNIGIVSGDTECGGICGSVNNTSVSNCVSLYGKCDVSYNRNDAAEIDNVYIKNALAFKSGEVCWILNGNKRSTTWRQHLGKDSFPIVTGDYLVYYYDDNGDYLNESMCDKTEDYLHTFDSKTMTQPNGTTINYWHCTTCGNDYQFYDRVNELPGTGRTQPSAGDGSQANPYQIATLENLLWFADQVNNQKKTSICAMLTADITMNASVLNSDGRSNGENFIAWTPIGTAESPFTGTLDGDGYTIRGLYQKGTSADAVVGFMGYVGAGGNVRNIIIKDSYLFAGNNIGKLCYNNNGGTINGYLYMGTLNGGSIAAGNTQTAVTDAQFGSGEVCWLLNGGSSDNVTWHQTLGENGDKYPTLTGGGIIYLTARKCDGIVKAFSNTKPESVTQDEHTLVTNDGKVHCEGCNKDFTNYLAIDNNPVLLNSENGSYTLDKVELKYGRSYLCTDEVDVVDFSYTFRYYPNVWNSWFVPFEITTDELGYKGFTAAYIAGVRQYEKDAEGNVITQVDVIKIKNGYLFAGTPYLIRQQSSATEPSEATFNKTGATLKKSSDVNPLNSATTTANYDFIGTYNEIAKEDVKSNYYILGSEGAFVHPSSPVYAMNWYMKITDKGTVYGQPAQAKAFIINVIGEENQTTGIRTIYPAEKQVKEVYDLGGYLLNAPKKGQINILGGKKILVK